MASTARRPAGTRWARRASGWSIPSTAPSAFVREIPFFSTQIALLRAGELVLGVSSAPRLRRARLGRGGRRCFPERPPGAREPHRGARRGRSISTGNLKSLTHGSPRWQRFGSLVRGVGRIRGYGDFVHYHLLARGALDVVIESDVNILDIAALTVIVREAGGTFTDLRRRGGGSRRPRACWPPTAPARRDARDPRSRADEHPPPVLLELDHRRKIQLAQAPAVSVSRTAPSVQRPSPNSSSTRSAKRAASVGSCSVVMTVRPARASSRNSPSTTSW